MMGYGAMVDHWHWPMSPGRRSCSKWSKRMAPSLALGHVGGLGGSPIQRFANGTAMMLMNGNFKGRGFAPNLKCLEVGFLPASTAEKPVPHTTAISIHMGHDANVAISIDGRVQCVLEFERLFGKRYYHLMGYGAKDWSDVLRLAPRYRSDFLEAINTIAEKCECEDGKPCPRSFDYAVVVEPHMMFDIPVLLEQVYAVKEWRWVHHHEAHALYGFLSSPFRRALVVSYDGGGDDGYYNAFYGHGQTVQRLARLDANFAAAYNSMTNVLTEIYPQCEKILQHYCQTVDTFFPWTGISVVRDSAKQLSDAGKIMGYSAVAANRPVPAAVRRVVTQHLDHFLGSATLDPSKRNRSMVRGTLPTELLQLACEGKDNQDLLAAELQRQWQQRSLELIQSLLKKLGPVDGVVLMGGCALNVAANQFIEDELKMEVFVPPAPSDCGISVGGLFSVSPPSQAQEMQYLGFQLWDRHILDQEAQLRGARRLSQLGGVDFLARLLATAKHGRKPIVAVVRGRQEFGPRALGHRSLLAVPDVEEMKHRMNQLKFRKWYRPIAPMIADEALIAVFGRKVLSRYMERAPKVLDWVLQDFPAMVHFDGTARHQSVGARDEPWLHQLLLAVAKHTGLAALINTSFNTRGKPIVNSVKESLEMLDTLPDLDYVLIEDYLFASSKGATA